LEARQVTWSLRDIEGRFAPAVQAFVDPDGYISSAILLNCSFLNNQQQDQINEDLRNHKFQSNVLGR